MNQKGHILLFIILIIAALGGYLVYQKQAKPTLTPQLSTQSSPTPVVSPIPTDAAETVYTEATRANWKTYTNNKWAYSIRYPGNYFLRESSKEEVVISPNEQKYPNLPQDIIIVTEKYLSKASIDEYVKQFPTVNNTGYKTFMIGGLEGKIGQLEGEVNYEEIFVNRGNNLYTIRIDQPQGQGMGIPSSILTRILSTFRFQ